MALEFNSDIAHDLLMEWKVSCTETNPIGNAPRKLIIMYYELLDSLISKASFKNYPDYVKDNMKSEATYQFLKYSHNYKPEKIKSKNGAFTFLAFNAECSFKKAIKTYYREKNMETLIADTVDVDSYYEKYSYNMINQLDSDADVNDKLDNWSHDDLGANR